MPTKTSVQNQASKTSVLCKFTEKKLRGRGAANGYGLHDVTGNIWERCWDWYGLSSYVTGATDPRGAASGWYRVVRGGGRSTSASFCRSSDRSLLAPSHPNSVIGFGLACSSVP